MNRLVDVVVRRIGIDVGDRFSANARKVKFVINGLPEDSDFPVKFTDFQVQLKVTTESTCWGSLQFSQHVQFSGCLCKIFLDCLSLDNDLMSVLSMSVQVVHHYLHSAQKEYQTRLRKRVRNGRATYTFTVRKPELQGQTVEVKQPISQRDYANLLAHRDDNHLPVFKTRRSFLYENQQYQLDIYRAPCHSRCQGLILLETFTTVPDVELMASLPPFLRVKRNTTGDPAFSMYNLSLRSDWADSADQFCHRLQLSSDDESDEEAVYDVKKASARLKAGTSESESVESL